MRAVRDGDRTALAVLFRRHHAAVYAYCARMLSDADAAADATQETFVRVLRYPSGYRDDSRLLPWLFTVARNVCRDAARRRTLQATTDGRWARERPDWVAPAGPGVREAAALEHVLARLDPQDREVLVLKRLHDLSYAEIAETLGCTPGAARVRVHRAMLRLRELCREEESRT